jgi:hypothetical protein
MREQAPTERQIKYLRRLGHHGPRPADRLEASKLIDRLLSKEARHEF